MGNIAILEYIKSNSKQYVPTDIMITQDDDIECDVEFTAISYQNYSGTNTIFDTRVSAGGPRIMLEMGARKIYYSTGFSGMANIQLADAELLNRHTYKITSAGRLLIDDADQGRQTSGTFGSYPIVFFGCQLDGHQDLTASTGGENNRLLWSNLKFYGCNIIRNGETIHELKPAYNREIGECGIYDATTDTFYANMDTTATKEDFEHPDIPQRVERAKPLAGGTTGTLVTTIDATTGNSTKTVNIEKYGGSIMLAIRNGGAITCTVKKGNETIKSYSGSNTINDLLDNLSEGSYSIQVSASGSWYTSTVFSASIK